MDCKYCYILTLLFLLSAVKVSCINSQTKIKEDSILIEDQYTGEFFYWEKTSLPTSFDAPDGVLYKKFEGNTIRKRKFKGNADVRWWGAKGDGKTNDAHAINNAVKTTASLNIPLFIKKTSDFYLITPYILDGDESTNMRKEIRIGIRMQSNMTIISDNATIKMASNISRREKMVQMRMFFSNDFLENIRISGLTIDMNGQNNLISQKNGSFVNVTQAHICFSGTKGNIAAGANNVIIENCNFVNGPGASCIIAAQSNSKNVRLGKNWIIRNNRFFNNGFDCNDHSSVYGWMTDVVCNNNTFDNPTMFYETGGLVAYEIHGSNQKFYSNSINNYYQGLWVGVNYSEKLVQNINIYDNKFSVSGQFLDFFNGNLNSVPYITDIQNVVIERNQGKITNDHVKDEVKQFVRIASVISPDKVYIRKNEVDFLSITKPSSFISFIVLPDQRKSIDKIYVTDNQATGMSLGMLVYFNKNIPQGTITFEKNTFGNYRRNNILVSSDILIYGSSGGFIRSIKTDKKNIVTDGSHKIQELKRSK